LKSVIVNDVYTVGTGVGSCRAFFWKLVVLRYQRNNIVKVAAFVTRFRDEVGRWQLGVVIEAREDAPGTIPFVEPRATVRVAVRQRSQHLNHDVMVSVYAIHF
jgi:hypothetical protein